MDASSNNKKKKQRKEVEIESPGKVHKNPKPVGTRSIQGFCKCDVFKEWERKQLDDIQRELYEIHSFNKQKERPEKQGGKSVT